MSSEDEEETFVGHEGHEVVADLQGTTTEFREEDDEPDDDSGQGEAHEDIQDDALHTFTGHRGICNQPQHPKASDKYCGKYLTAPFHAS